jgi:hypothetical protein
MGVPRADGFLNEVLHDADGLVISSTAGTSSTTLVADGFKRLAVDAFLSGGTIPVVVTPTANRSSWIPLALAPGAGIASQLSADPIPDGFALVIKNRSTNLVGTVLFVSNSLVNLATATSRTELQLGESMSLFIDNMDLVFFQLSTDQFIEVYVEQ